MSSWRNRGRVGELRGLDALNEWPLVDAMAISALQPLRDVPRPPKRASLIDQLIAVVARRSRSSD